MKLALIQHAAAPDKGENVARGLRALEEAARAGEAFRVVLMAPRAETSRRTVVGTLVAERVLDVTVIVAVFVIVGYAVLGEVGDGSVEAIGIVTVVLVAGAIGAYLLVRRNER